MEALKQAWLEQAFGFCMQHSLDLFLQILVSEPTRGHLWWKGG